MDRLRYRLLAPLPLNVSLLGQSWELRMEHYQEYWALQAHEGGSPYGYCAVRLDSAERFHRALYESGEEVHPRSVFARMFEKLITEGKAEKVARVAPNPQ
jgi:hypothetical protein